MKRWLWALTLTMGLALLAAPLWAQFRFDLTVLTSRDDEDLILDVVDPSGNNPPAEMSLNAFELIQGGNVAQARRAATVFIELDWGGPPPPLAMLRLELDRTQLGSGSTRIFPLNLDNQNVIALDPDTRAVVLQGRAQALRLDANGNLTQQQGTLTVTVLDSRAGGLEFALFEYEESGGYTFQYLAVLTDGELFTHRRIVP